VTYMRSTLHALPLESMLDCHVNQYLPDDLLINMDVAMIAHSLETRSPLLDHKVMEFIARVLAQLKLRRGESKYLLKFVLRGIPVTRSSTGRTWVSAWRWGLGFAATQGNADRYSAVGSRAVTRLLQKGASLREMASEHMACSNNHQHVLWDLLLRERWHRMFIDQAALREPMISGSVAV
jgi:asparagine synthase (glutamine-hydrolysing)